MARRYAIILLLFLLWFGVGICEAGTSTDFILYASKLGIQQGYRITGALEWLLLESTSGMLNSSSNSLTFSPTSGSGSLTFLSNETVSFTISFGNLKVSVGGDQGKAKRYIENATSVSANAGNTITISWGVIVQPLLPYLFILGMLGLGSMFGGSLYTIHLFKKKEYRWALVQGVTFISVGFGLFIAWVFA